MPFRYSERKGEASVYNPATGEFERKPLAELHRDETDDELLSVWLNWLPAAVSEYDKRQRAEK